MRVVVLGGGTAGAMASMHLTRFCSGVELVQIRDPQTPIIGVGESTTAGVHSWLRTVIPDRLAELESRCGLTTKRGVRFEGWGTAHPVFTHDFVPRDNDGAHLSARDLVTVLDESIRAVQLQTRVHEIAPDPAGGSTVRTDAGDQRADLVVDARGFPARLDPEEHVAFTWIPTGVALVSRGPARPRLTHTRAVARPYGWIFAIPLQHQTACGYITRSRDVEAADADFTAWQEEEGVVLEPPRRRISFPNFVRRRVFDGRVFTLGNAASFIEPLEATALAVIRTQLPLLEAWVNARRSSRAIAERLVDAIDAQLRTAIVEVSVFIGFHYSRGSVWSTPFWDDARARFEADLEGTVPAAVRARFRQHLDLGLAIGAEAVRAAADRGELESLLARHESPPSFGGISPLGFAQVAAGLGYDSPAAAPQSASEGAGTG